MMLHPLKLEAIDNHIATLEFKIYQHMNSSQTLLFDDPQAKGLASPKSICLFYSGAAALLLTLMFLGFLQFYLHGRAYPNLTVNLPLRFEHYSSCTLST
jgi:hypothetical protein